MGKTAQRGDFHNKSATGITTYVLLKFYVNSTDFTP